MVFRFLGIFFTIINLSSCSSEQNDSNLATMEKKSDTCESYINLNSTTPHNLNQDVDISNTIYSLESFKLKDSLQHFVCKTTIEETGTSTWMHGNRSERFEFFDYDFNKKFEISADRREIDLEYEYFITRSLFTDLPRLFELNNYETNEAFVKCSGVCWTAEIPNGKTVAYFGYQSNGPTTDKGLQHLGTLYYGINGHLNSELRFFFYPEQRYHGLVSISLEPEVEGDKTGFTNSEIRKLTLWSQNGKTGKEFITDFEIKVKLKREKIHKSNQYESLDYIIAVDKGELKGNNLIATDYGYQLILQ